MVEIREYQESSGRNPFREWYDRLNVEAARKVTTAIYRMGLGNFSNAKSIGFGVSECRINFGPGYRVYSAKMESGLSFCLAAEQSIANSETSRPRCNAGEIINSGKTPLRKKNRSEHGTNAGLQSFSSGSREA